jgi:transposase
MKIALQNPLVKTHDRLLLCADVAKDHLDLFTRYHDGYQVRTRDQRLDNTTDTIEAALAHYAHLAEQTYLDGLTVVCEASGGYEQKLLRTARRLGHQTALVSPEHVAQLRKVETNDTGKTDHKDPRVIALVAQLGKTQRHRLLAEPYALLRRLTSDYDQDERCLCACKTRIHSLILDLYPDYKGSAVFTFDTTGRALMDAYAFDPYAIRRAGYRRFQAKMKRRVKFVRFRTLEKLFAWAEASARYERPEAVILALRRRLQALSRDLERLEQRMDALKAEIEAVGETLKEATALPTLDEALSGVTLFNLARLVGQTGPLSDFATKRALLRYAGLNLRERQSGQYRGQTRLSKKGRILLRKVLSQAVFPLLRGDRLYGPYYAQKRRQGMCDQKAKVAVMRKFLGVVWSLARSGEPFDVDRFHLSASQYRRYAMS